MAISISKSALQSLKIGGLKDTLLIKPKLQPWMKSKNPQWAKKSEDDKTVSLLREDEHNVYMPFYFGSQLLKCNNDNLDHARVGIKFTGQIRDYQRPHMDEAMRQLNTTRTTMFNNRPGTGKTTMMCALSCYIGLFTLVLIKNSTLYKQWKKTYEDRTNASVWCIGEGPIPQYVDVIVCLWTRVSQIPEEMRSKVGTLLVDECHRFNNKGGVDSILLLTPKFLIFATATFEKANDMHLAMEAFVGRHKVSNTEIIPFTVVRYYTQLVYEKTKRNNTTNWTKLIQSIMYDKIRNDIIVELVHKLVALGRKILIFTAEVRHVRILYEMIVASGITSCDWFAEGKMNYKDSSVLISNPKKAGEGFDEEMFCDDYNGVRIDTVILASSLKDLALLYQMCGRAFRTKVRPWVIDMVDNVDTTERQYKEREWWYERNGGVVSRQNHVPKQLEPTVETPVNYIIE